MKTAFPGPSSRHFDARRAFTREEDRAGFILQILPARCALMCLLAHAGGALAYIAPSAAVDPGSAFHFGAGDHAIASAPSRHAALVIASLGRSVSGLAQSLPSSLHTRAVFTSGNANRKDAVPGPNKSAARRSAAKPGAARAAAPVVTATAPGAGQSGYVHYFVIDTPHGEHETQIGIELPDGRIAWSFPELGVVVSPFIASGEMAVNGGIYTVQHRYAIRPFPDNESMLALQKELLQRVIPWVEDGTPYCNQAERSNQLCLSCLGFVMRVLYPSRSGSFTALPADFRGGASGLYITTEDLLLYQAGLHGFRSREARLKRIERLAIPQRLREDLTGLVSSMEPDENAGSVASGAPPKPSAKKRAGVRSSPKAGQPRPSQSGKL